MGVILREGKFEIGTAFISDINSEDDQVLAPWSRIAFGEDRKISYTSSPEMMNRLKQYQLEICEDYTTVSAKAFLTNQFIHFGKFVITFPSYF